MATHSSILAWETPWAEESGGLQGVTKSRGVKNPWGHERVRHNLGTK